MWLTAQMRARKGNKMPFYGTTPTPAKPLTKKQEIALHKTRALSELRRRRAYLLEAIRDAQRALKEYGALK